MPSRSLPAELVRSIRNPDPLEGADILIEDDDGALLAAVIQPRAYRFLLRMIAEQEDRIDERTVGEYDPEGTTLDDLSEVSS